MKIYFAGSISGGRDDAALYSKIIDLLQNYGDVLTEHIGNSGLSDQGEQDFTKDYIFKRDVALLESSDWVVAEVTAPSLGVGYELGISEKLGKNVLCLFRENSGKRLSAMVEGNSSFITQYYSEFLELENIFNKYLK